MYWIILMYIQVLIILYKLATYNLYSDSYVSFYFTTCRLCVRFTAQIFLKWYFNISIRAGRYIEFVRYIDIFFISDKVWGNTILSIYSSLIRAHLKNIAEDTDSAAAEKASGIELGRSFHQMGTVNVEVRERDFVPLWDGTVMRRSLVERKLLEGI